jgi:hypothetical protein
MCHVSFYLKACNSNKTHPWILLCASLRAFERLTVQFTDRNCLFTLKMDVVCSSSCNPGVYKGDRQEENMASLMLLRCVEANFDPRR